MAGDKSVECIAEVEAVLGEGPVWVEREQKLYWVDIKGRRLFRLDAEGEIVSWNTPLRVGSLAPRDSGGFVAGTDQGLAWVDPERDRYEVFARPEPDRPDNRFNDGKVDRSGRFWAGTMDDKERAAAGALYRLDPGCEPVRVDDGYQVTNGPAFSPDGRIMYHNDSGRQLVYAFDVDDEGGISNRRILARFGEGQGYPDGMTVDREGCLWVAFWDGWCLRRLSSDGECLRKIDLPVQRPTSCAFGGPRLDRLYVTSASIGLDDSALAVQSCAGGLLLLEPGVTGIAAVPFAG